MGFAAPGPEKQVEEITVKTKGGDMKVNFKTPESKGKVFTKITLEGPAKFVFEGKMPIE